VSGARGKLTTSPTSAFRRLRGDAGETRPSTLMSAEQSNTSIRYGDRFVLKLMRRLERGENPELEITRYLTEVAPPGSTAALGGFIEYRAGRGEPLTLAVLQEFVPNQGDAWTHALDALGTYFESAAARDQDESRGRRLDILALLGRDLPEPIRESIGPYLQYAGLLGRRLAELHNQFARDTSDDAFRPEPFTALTQRSLYQSLRTQARTALRLLQRNAPSLSDEVRELARQVLDREADLLRLLEEPTKRRIESLRTRRHGDFHLGQVLFTGNDFVIIDFEGEPAKSMSERKLKRSPLTDVAGLLRSYEYAAQSGARREAEREGLATPTEAHLARADAWTAWCGAAFLESYLEAVSPALVPSDRDQLRDLLRAFLLDKALYEVAYELNHRPDWVAIPLRGVLRLSDDDATR